MFCPVLRGFLCLGVIALGSHAQSEDGPIDLSKYRQLFVDDYLIAETRHLHRVLHDAKRHPDNLLIISDCPWEEVDVYLYGRVVNDQTARL